ncbi:MAG: hypothetical protein QW186_08700 [Candidatus Bathyarchaeia archaeon]
MSLRLTRKPMGVSTIVAPTSVNWGTRLYKKTTFPPNFERYIRFAGAGASVYEFSRTKLKTIVDYNYTIQPGWSQAAPPVRSDLIDDSIDTYWQLNAADDQSGTIPMLKIDLGAVKDVVIYHRATGGGTGRSDFHLKVSTDDVNYVEVLVSGYTLGYFVKVKGVRYLLLCLDLSNSVGVYERIFEFHIYECADASAKTETISGGEHKIQTLGVPDIDVYVVTEVNLVAYTCKYSVYEFDYSAQVTGAMPGLTKMEVVTE